MRQRSDEDRELDETCLQYLVGWFRQVCAIREHDDGDTRSTSVVALHRFGLRRIVFEVDPPKVDLRAVEECLRPPAILSPVRAVYGDGLRHPKPLVLPGGETAATRHAAVCPAWLTD